MPPDAVLETERARFRERQRQEWRRTRARLVRQACPTPTEEAIRAEIEERYAHVSADERAAIARLATAPDGTRPKSEPEGRTEVKAKMDRNGERKGARPGKSRLTKQQQAQALDICRKRLAEDPNVTGAAVWKELCTAGLRVSEPTFYTKYWREAKAAKRRELHDTPRGHCAEAQVQARENRDDALGGPAGQQRLLSPERQGGQAFHRDRVARRPVRGGGRA